VTNQRLLDIGAVGRIFNVDTSMKTRVQKWGNSLALRIPRAFARESKVVQGSAVELTVEEGRLVITPVRTASYSLKALLAGVTNQNLHTEIDTGPAAGQEVW
jgi:antitoxin MazE